MLGFVMLKELSFLWCVESLEKVRATVKNPMLGLTTLSRKNRVTWGAGDSCALIREVFLLLLF